MTDTALVKTPKLYDKDFYAWTQEQSDLLRTRHLLQLDFENLAEEVQSMDNRHKSAVSSNLRVVLMHLLKKSFQQDRQTRSWMSSIFEYRSRLQDAFTTSPSLRRYARLDLNRCYRGAREGAAIETSLPISTFPETCPFTFEQVLDNRFLPVSPAPSAVTGENDQ